MKSGAAGTNDAYGAIGGILDPYEIILGSVTLEELMMAVRVIGYLQSFQANIGVRESEFWIDRIRMVSNRHYAGITPVCYEAVTRRYGLRKRVCEILGASVCGCDEPFEPETSISISMSSMLNDGYLKKEKLFDGSLSDKYSGLFRLIESGDIVNRRQLIGFLRKAFDMLGGNADIPDDACDECLRKNLLEAVILAHPDHHQNSEMSVAMEPEYNRLAAIMLGLRAKLSCGGFEL